MTVRVLHAADLHLDSPFAALGEERAALRRQESRRQVRRLVDWANEQEMALMLLAGDLFDADAPYRPTAPALAEALGAFRGQVVIAPGNHDWYDGDSAWAKTAWPENVHLFRENRLTRLDFPQYRCRVYGAAFTAPTATDDVVPEGFAAPREDGWVNLLVLHGDLGRRESLYRPLREEALAASGVDYAALGHRHSFSGLNHSGAVTWAYPGCLEGRGFDETGEKGFLAGTVASGRADMAFVPFARRRYAILPVDVTGRDALGAVLDALPPETARDTYRLVLTGETGESISPAALERELADRFYALEVRDETRLARDIWDGCGEETLRGLFLRELRGKYEAATEEEERRRIRQAVRFGLAALEGREL